MQLHNATQQELANKIQLLKEKLSDEEIISLLEEDILKMDVSYISYIFCRYIHGANIKEHEKIIFKDKQLLNVVNWALYVEGADIDTCQDIVLHANDDSLDYYSVLLMFTKVKGADLKKIEDKFLKLNNPNGSYLFAKDVEGANIEAHEQIVAQSNNADLCAGFIKNVKGANKKVLEQGALKSNNILALNRFMNDIDDIDKKAFKERIKELENKSKILNKKLDFCYDVKRKIDDLLKK